jgi:hypothetical protein
MIPSLGEAGQPGYAGCMVTAAALGGQTEGGEPVAILTLETPMKIPFGGRRLTKPELERAHLEKYRLDVLTATGVLPFDTVMQGGDPPDFVVATPAGAEGVECAALALQQRRHAYALFERFRTRLLDAARQEPFTHLADCVAAIWFGNGNKLPPPANDETAVDQLVAMLRAAQVDRAAIAEFNAQVAQEGLPETLPLGSGAVPIFEAGDAGGANITPLDPNSLQGPFPEATGFDLRLQMTVTVTSSDVQTELERLVTNHDQPGVDRLLISIGAPNRDGLLFPGEPLVFEQLPPPAPVETRHIRVVTMHGFTTGAVRDL